MEKKFRLLKERQINHYGQNTLERGSPSRKKKLTWPHLERFVFIRHYRSAVIESWLIQNVAPSWIYTKYPSRICSVHKMKTFSAKLQYWLEVPDKCLCAGQIWRVPSFSFQAWATDRTLS